MGKIARENGFMGIDRTGNGHGRPIGRAVAKNTATCFEVRFVPGNPIWSRTRRRRWRLDFCEFALGFLLLLNGFDHVQQIDDTMSNDANGRSTTELTGVRCPAAIRSSRSCSLSPPSIIGTKGTQ